METFGHHRRFSVSIQPNGSIPHKHFDSPRYLRTWWRRIKTKNKCTLTVLLFIVIFFFVTSSGILRVISEFGIQNNYNPTIFEDYEGSSSQGYVEVPKTLHQIFFNVSERSTEFWETYQPYSKSWIYQNPDYEYMLWNKTMVNDLIVNHYPDIASTYNKYEDKFNIQTDIARYLIVHHVGGVYIDMDIKCKGSIKQLYDQMGSKTIALNFTFNPIGMATDFFVASKHHKFLEHVIDGLPAADVTYFTPYVNVMLKTGPLFLFGRYLNYPYKDDIFSIPLELIQNLADRSKFGRSWHEVDGVIISFIWDRLGRVVFFVPILLIIFVKIMQWRSRNQHFKKTHSVLNHKRNDTWI